MENKSKQPEASSASESNGLGCVQPIAGSFPNGQFPYINTCSNPVTVSFTVNTCNSQGSHVIQVPFGPNEQKIISSPCLVPPQMF